MPSRLQIRKMYGPLDEVMEKNRLLTAQTSELLEERLRAWKHAVGYLEEYVSATEKLEKAHAKEYEKVLKASSCSKCYLGVKLTGEQTISDPLKEGHHFDQSLGGIAGLFENMRANTQAR